MKTRRYLPVMVVLAAGLFSLACLLPGMIPLTGGSAGPQPAMEKDEDKVLETLNARNYVRLEELAKEKYTDQDVAKPGTWKYTIKITDKKPTLFGYLWCAADDKTLQQNFEHIKVGLYFNGDALGKDVVHVLSFHSANDLACANFGVLMTDWPAGKYNLKAVAIFEEKINDGLSDYPAGDYVFEYAVDVPE